jgi:hypothetical protein
MAPAICRCRITRWPASLTIWRGRVTSSASRSRSWWATAWEVAFELARRHPDLPAAVVALDSAIVRPDWLAPEARQHAAGLRGPDYQEVQQRYAEEFFLPTDDADIKARLVAGLSSLPRHVTLSAWEQHLLVWDGEGGGCGLPGAGASDQFRIAAV